MRTSITIVLMLVLGGLTGISVGSVLLVSGSASLKNTRELSTKRAELTVNAIERGLNDNLAPAQNMIQEISRRITNGTLNLSDRNRLAATLGGALASAPQMGGVVIWQPEIDELWVRRTAAGEITVRDVPGPDREVFNANTRAFDDRERIYWSPPTYFDQQTFVNLRKPLYRDDVIVGVIATGISLSSLSNLIGDLAIGDLTPFVLYGNNKVLAHPALLDADYARLLSPAKAVLSVNEIDDPVLAAFPGLKATVSAADLGLDVHITKGGDGSDVILSRTSADFGSIPWRIGAYVPMDSVNSQFRRLMGSFAVGVGMLILSVVASLFLAQRMARPIRALSAAAEKIERLELETIEPLMRSRIRELDEQAQSFNRMTHGLRWFQAYVPRRLVRRLMDNTEGPARDVREANLTVMFTDLIGFTSLSEKLEPAQIATLLNEHFEIINGCIEAEMGTLDKFIGDAAMAFWGAPDPMTDHAARACRASLAIADAVTALNRRSEGPALQIKIGLHSGPLIVGNIGAKTRMNYTVIGDTVNVCARIEALAGKYAKDDPAIILVSGDLVEAAGECFVFDPIGDQHVKGRKQRVSVWRLVKAANEPG